ncbi:MAG: carbohydrate ABC transporter permease [Oscillospiraceae bacterium]|jgi:multiple sugar transport system permease protein|nr:carbohydrate ABC transporter permease [Oscillospiraceae bacterium]
MGRKTVDGYANYTAGILAKKTLIHIVCIFLAILSIAPFYLMVVNATSSSLQIRMGLNYFFGSSLAANYKVLMDQSFFNFYDGFISSFIIAASATFLSCYFSTLAAYSIIVYDYKLRKAAYAFILGVMMIPSMVSSAGFVDMVYKWNMYDTYWPLIIPAIAAPAVVFFMKQYMEGALPLEIVEASRIDGCSEFGTFNRIALPIMKPAIATQAIFGFITNWNQLFMPSMILSSMEKKTMPMLVEILKSNRYKTEYGTVYLGLTITIIPMFVVYIFLSRYIIAGVALGSLKE